LIFEKTKRGGGILTQIITDSAADLPADIIDKYNIHVVPLTVNIDGKEYFDRVNLSAQEFYQKMATTKTLPKTSGPSVAAFIKAFSDLAAKGELLCINISSGLSSTYQTACLAKEMSGVNVKIFDTWTTSLGQGLHAIKAAMLNEKGFSRTEIINKLTHYRNTMTNLVLLDTLENVVKGGRLSKVQGSLAKLLNIKVLLTGDQGKLVVQEKVHGKKKAFKILMEMINDGAQKAKNITTRLFSITHCNNIKDAEYLKNHIMDKYQPCEVIVNDMGPTIATYSGKGGLIISFLE
jgi:DegV family protein with EDD domain